MRTAKIEEVGWHCTGTSVWPANDLREHDIDNDRCWCCPWYSDHILVHQSADRREEFEQGRKVS